MMELASSYYRVFIDASLSLRLPFVVRFNSAPNPAKLAVLDVTEQF